MGGCSAPNCSNRSSVQGVRTFRVPTNAARRLQWQINSKRDHLTENASFCEIHFEESQFERHREDGWRKLKPNAVPTIFSNGIKLRGAPKNESGDVSAGPNDASPAVTNDTPARLPSRLAVNDNEAFVAVHTGRRRCCVCHKGVFLPHAVAIAKTDNVCSDFGRILCYVLKASESSLLTRYCCMACSEQVLQCFELLIDINVSTMLTSRRCGRAALSDALSQGCPYCSDVIPAMDKFTEHFMQHVLDNDPGKTSPSLAPAQPQVPQSDKLGVDQQIDGEETIVLQDRNDKPELIREEHSYNKVRRSKITECSRVCHLCGRKFSSRFTLSRHMARHDDPEFPRDPKALCKPSDRKDTNPERLDTTPLECELCGDTFTQRFSLVNHTVLRHGGNLAQLYRNRGKRRAWVCGVCGEPMSSFRKLSQHSEAAHGGAPQTKCHCELCGKTYKNKTCLRKHIKHSHVDHYRYRCSVCGRRLTSQDTLQRHMVAKHQSPPKDAEEKTEGDEAPAYDVTEMIQDGVLASEGVADIVEAIDLDQVIFYIPDQDELRKTYPAMHFQ